MNLLESKLLEKLAHELLKAFLLAEETYFEEQGVQKPYTSKVTVAKHLMPDAKNVHGRYHPLDMVSIVLYINPGAGKVFAEAAKRLKPFAEEFFEDHLFKVKLNTTRTIGTVALQMWMEE